MQTKRQYNLQNLRPFTSEEARACQAKALIARKEKRERSEAIVKAAAAISDAPVSDDELKEKLLSLGVEDEELRNSALIAAGGGLPVWANLMLAVADEVDACMQGELKKREARIAKYTAKYKKRSPLKGIRND